MRWTKSVMVGACLLLQVGMSSPVYGASPDEGTAAVRVAFVRHGDLWITLGSTEQQITHKQKVSSPRWSEDGAFLAYLVRVDTKQELTEQLHVRNLGTNEDTVVYTFRGGNVRRVEWSPTRDVLAFQDHSILNTVDTRNLGKSSFHNAALGVSQFSWFPDGRGFLVSRDADLLPDGWTHVSLYRVSLPDAKSKGLGKTRVIDTLPKEVRAGGVTVRAIGTSGFQWSPDGRWMAFLVHPTASLSADENVLCALSTDTGRFVPIAPVLYRDDWFSWAPHSNQLAYIRGGGRSVLDNKRIAVSVAPRFQEVALYTAEGFVDNSFTWNDDSSWTVSRAKEKSPYTKSNLASLPSLYAVDVHTRAVHRITRPPMVFGDYQPRFVRQGRRLVWIRANEGQASMWIGDRRSTKGTQWIRDIDSKDLDWSEPVWNALVDVR